MAVQGVPCELENIRRVVQNLRPRDREELFALRWNDNEDELVQEIHGYAGAMSVCWTVDGEPVSLQGVAPVRPGVWQVWCFGTLSWNRVLLSMTKHARRFIIPALLRANFHRAQAFALASHTDARKWIEALGGRYEALHPGTGRNGEDFVTYVWTPEDVRRRR